MNFKERLTNLELAELNDDMIDAAWDAAYERACELASPNSIEFDRLHESIFEELLS